MCEYAQSLPLSLSSYRHSRHITKVTGTGASQKHDAGRASIEDPGLSLAAMKGGGWTDSMLWRAHIRKSPCKWECFGDQEGREGGKKGMDFPNKNKRVVSSVHLCSVGSLATVCSPCSPPILAHPVLQMYFSCFPPYLPPPPPPPLLLFVAMLTQVYTIWPCAA